ncbi:MAG: hypothetical protein ACRC9T_03975 [Vibrionaceae bacterium]
MTDFKSNIVYIDLLFIIENLLPGKRNVALLRRNQNLVPVRTLTLSVYDSVSALQLALYKHCPNYAAFACGKPLADDYAIDGKDEHIFAATEIVAHFIRGAYWWVEHYLNTYKEEWSEAQKNRWQRDFKLLVQTIIGIGNCQKASWLIDNHHVIKSLTFHSHAIPFLQHYD